jgi:hypothetical protein
MENIKCPFCGMVDCAGAMLCKRCGAKIVPDGGEQFNSVRVEPGNLPGNVVPQASHRLKPCPICFAPCAESARACPHCGHALKRNVADVAKWVGFALLPLVLIGSLFLALRFYAEKAAEVRLKDTKREMAERYGIVDTTVQPQEQKPWFWSLFRSNPTVREILEHNEEAVGGREAILGVKSERMNGEFYIVDRSTQASSAYVANSGKIVVQAKSPNFIVADMEFKRNTYSKKGGNAVGLVRLGFDGARGWEYTERYFDEPGFATPVKRGELRMLDAPELGRLRSHTEALGLVSLKDKFRSFRLDGREKVGVEVSSGFDVLGREAYVVRGTTLDNETETLYFDIETGLLARLDFTEGTGNNRVAVECYPQDYRQVGKLKLPFTLAYKIKETRITIRFDNINLNTDVADSAFLMPAS